MPLRNIALPFHTTYVTMQGQTQVTSCLTISLGSCKLQLQSCSLVAGVWVEVAAPRSVQSRNITGKHSKGIFWFVHKDGRTSSKTSGVVCDDCKLQHSTVMPASCKCDTSIVGGID